MDDEPINIGLNEIWRAIRKIQSGLFRYHINLWDYFRPLDQHHNGLISESKFTNGLARLKKIIGLTDFEIREVTDYFRQRDGRIAYEQFCNVTCEEGQNHKNKDFVTGQEWNDPLHVNIIADSEQRRLCILLTRIAHTVRLRDIVLLPYFQDYEISTQNNGTVTVSHFSRVLHFLKIVVSEADFLLLLKRYMKNSYTVNYVAFVKHVTEIVKNLDSHRLIDTSQDIINNFPGRLIDAELPKLPRPEVGKVNMADVFGAQTTFHPVFNEKAADRDLEELMLRLQRHIHENRIRTSYFLEPFDLLGVGFITTNQFIRGLESIGVSALHRLYLTQKELKMVAKKYGDVSDSDRVDWKRFCEDIDKVFTIKKLELKPFVIIKSPDKINELPRVGQNDWNKEKSHIRSLADEAMYKVKGKIENRRIYLQQFFRDFDKTNIGHVSKDQMRQVLFSNGIYLSNEEFYALDKRYFNDLGFNYKWFLEEADPFEYSLPKFKTINSTKKKPTGSPECLPKTKPSKKCIVDALANVKKQAVIKQSRIMEFMRDYDPLGKGVCSENDFRRGLDNASIILSEKEVDIICEIFRTPLCHGTINYKQFCLTVEEVFVQSNLERAPLLIPLQHFPSTDCVSCVLNFEERNIVSCALQKLAKKPDLCSNLLQIFQDYDRENCGTVNQNNFLRALTIRNMSNIISSHEFEVVCKCFGVERGFHLEVDYRAFLRILDILHSNGMKNPF